jgi:glutaredoxin
MKALIVILALGLSAAAHAATLYKSIGPDGEVVYSDRPPASGKVDKTFEFSNLPSTPLPESVVKYRDELRKSMEKRLAESAVPRGRQPVIFTAKWCGYCRQALAYLAEKKISYTEHDIDTPGGMRAFAETGAGRGVPLLLVGEQKLQGYSRPAYETVFSRAR